MIEGQKESLSQIPQLKYAMIGGGTGSFIGDVHRKAIAMDGKARLVAGCFPEITRIPSKRGKQSGWIKAAFIGTMMNCSKLKPVIRTGLILSSLSLPMIRIIRSPARLSNLDFR